MQNGARSWPNRCPRFHHLAGKPRALAHPSTRGVLLDHELHFAHLKTDIVPNTAQIHFVLELDLALKHALVLRLEQHLVVSQQ